MSLENRLMDMLDEHKKRNILLWSAALGVNLKSEVLGQTSIPQRPRQTIVHDGLLQAIWHGPPFLDERQGNYNPETIVDAAGCLLPFRVEDVDAATMARVMERYDEIYA